MYVIQAMNTYLGHLKYPTSLEQQKNHRNVNTNVWSTITVFDILLVKTSNYKRLNK